MNDQQLLRYSRHILVDAIGVKGQEKLLAAHVLIIGAGGLGSPAALYLASAGVGTLSIADGDTVELSNLQRQILHSDATIGTAKTQSAQQALARTNPDCLVQPLPRLEDQALRDAVAHADVVLDCSDNFATRYALNRACVALKKPLVSGAAIRLTGQLFVMDPRQPSTPCYACLFPPDQQFEEVQCSTMGVFAPLVGIIGTMQAAEALKLVAGIGESLANRLLLLDARNMEWTAIRTTKASDCSVCSGSSGY